MGFWFDLIAFALTFSAFVGAIIGVRYVAKQVSSTVSATKEQLKNRGLTISDKGVSVRTTSRYSREDYVDATQRGFIKAMGAASFSTAENINGGSNSQESPSSPTAHRQSLSATHSSPTLSRHNSSTSVHTNGGNGSGSEKGSLTGTKEEKEKKRFRLGLKKRNSES